MARSSWSIAISCSRLRRRNSGKRHEVACGMHEDTKTRRTRKQTGFVLFVSSYLRVCASTLVAAFSVLWIASAQAPPDTWPQFRGSAALVGTSSATLPPTLKVLWTYEAGEAGIDSSAAIAGGVVYVGS